MIEARVVNQEPKDYAITGYKRGEMRELTSSTGWSKYLFDGRLVIDALKPGPSVVSCTSECMRAFIPGIGALVYCIILVELI